jgi:hypothetical protein
MCTSATTVAAAVHTSVVAVYAADAHSIAGRRTSRAELGDKSDPAAATPPVTATVGICTREERS